MKTIYCLYILIGVATFQAYASTVRFKRQENTFGAIEFQGNNHAGDDILAADDGEMLSRNWKPEARGWHKGKKPGSSTTSSNPLTTTLATTSKPITTTAAPTPKPIPTTLATTLRPITTTPAKPITTTTAKPTITPNPTKTTPATIITTLTTTTVPPFSKQTPLVPLPTTLKPRPTRPTHDDDRPIWGSTVPNTKPTPKPIPTKEPEIDKEKDPDENSNNQNENSNCMAGCRMSAESYPVCGNNGDTYLNMGHVLCARKCGFQVMVVSIGPCSESNGSSNSNGSTSQQSVKQCLRDCPTTSDYSPVCGTDSTTYDNLSRLLCAKLCGRAIDLRHRGPCGNRPNTTDPPIVPDKDILSTSTTQSPNTRDCIRNCPVTSEHNPVCGSDGVTYMNPGRLRCAQSCGVEVRMLSSGTCRTTVTTSKTPTRSTTPSSVSKACLSRCPMRDDDNSVCGSDNFTYRNPTHLYCAQLCGSDVTFVSRGPCSSTPITSSSTLEPEKDTVTATPSTTSSTTPSNACIQSCPSTPEYNPVCGTNYVTYNNLGKLQCAQSCGIDVDLLRPGPCTTPRPRTMEVTESPSRRNLQTLV